MSSSEPVLAVENLEMRRAAARVLRSVSFTVGAGELFSLLGPNGSGKTTLLRIVAGLERPTAGRVRLDGSDLARLPAHRRGIPLMFQDAVLLPHRTVYENLAYAPLLQRRPLSEVRAEVAGVVELLHLEGLVDRRPDGLSGGERQRVALGRTLAARPRVVLLDEPFASVDPELRAELRSEFRRVLRAIGASAVHVTHDREEALFLGDRVGLLFGGELETVGPPATVFGRPGSVRAARFLGYNVVRSPVGPVAVDARDVRIAGDAIHGTSATVRSVGTLGRETLVIFETSDRGRVELRSDALDPVPRIGDAVRLHWTRTIPLSAG